MFKVVSSHLFATVFAAAALATSPGALAQSHTNDEQNVAIASYVDTPEGCLIADLFITSVITEPPEPVLGFSSLFIYRSSNNCATHLVEGGFVEVLASGSTDQNPTEFTLHPRLTSGTLKTTMGVVFWQLGGDERPVFIDLVFDGIEGTLSPYKELNRSGSGPNGPVIWHFRGNQRQATASGSVSDGTTNYMANAIAVQGWLRVIHSRRSGPKPRMWH